MIDLVQRQLAAIYDIETPDVRDFLIGKDDVDAVKPGVRGEAREWVLVREDDDGVDIGVYIDEGLLERVEGMTPAEAAEDLPAWTAIVEGVSHFLLLIRRACRDEPVSLLELETQAEVDKFASVHFLRGPDPTLRRRLFAEARLHGDLDAAERERYTEAGRLADRFCAGIERLPHGDAKLGALRRFYRQAPAERLRRLRAA